MGNTFQTKADIMVCETFCEAFERLLLQKSFEKITTTEIINESGLARTTFYKHFRDKYDLSNWRFNHLHEYLPAIPNSVSEGDNNIAELVHLFGEQRTIYKKLFQYKGQNSFDDFYRKWSDDFVQRIAESSGRQLSVRDTYINCYHCMGALAVIKDWILSDNPISEDEIRDIIISQSRTESVRELYVNNKK